MASPLRKLAHQHTIKGSGVNSRQTMQQRMPQQQMRFQGQQQRQLHSPQNHQLRLQNPQHQQQVRHNPPGNMYVYFLYFSTHFDPVE